MSKFHVVWTDKDGKDCKEVYNSYYLATICKGKLVKEGLSASIIEKGATWGTNKIDDIKYSKAEKGKIKKLKDETSNKIREDNKEIYANVHKGPISRTGLGRVRRSRAFSMIRKGKLR